MPEMASDDDEIGAVNASGEEPHSPPPPDTPELEFQPVHAALPSLSDPFLDEDDGGPDYEGAWLSDPELEALGDISGLRVLNVLAGTGEDAIVLARMGANVVVTNLEEANARDFATAEGLSIEFTSEHEQSLPPELREGAFDVVYVGPDSLCWVENLDEWAWGLADALAPGGRIVIHDEHPLTYVFASMANMMVVNTSYFGEALEDPENDAIESGAPARGDAEGSSFGWTLGDLVTALGDHGVATVRLDELPSSERFFTAVDALSDVSDDDRQRVPAAFLLVGVKLSGALG